jgi:hypothetical protein
MKAAQTVPIPPSRFMAAVMPMKIIAVNFKDFD